MFESHSENGYVFGKEFRNFYRIGLTFLAICMLAFSIMLWIASTKPGSSSTACMLVSVLPISILVWIPITMKRNVWLIDLQFMCSNDLVSNIARKGTRSHQMDHQNNCLRLTIPFYWGKGRTEEAFFLISEKLVSVQQFDGNGGLSVLQSIWEKTDAVILPVNECTLQWINNHFAEVDTTSVQL